MIKMKKSTKWTGHFQKIPTKILDLHLKVKLKFHRMLGKYIAILSCIATMVMYADTMLIPAIRL